jgi:hypothetical protein
MKEKEQQIDTSWMDKEDFNDSIGQVQDSPSIGGGAAGSAVLSEKKRAAQIATKQLQALKNPNPFKEGAKQTRKDLLDAWEHTKGIVEQANMSDCLALGLISPVAVPIVATGVGVYAVGDGIAKTIETIIENNNR